MRARLLAVMVTALVLVLAAPALAGPREDAQARRKLLAGQTARAAVIQNGETKENLEQVVVNHFGNPDQGQVLIQTWVEPDWTNFEAVDIQGGRPGGQDPPGRRRLRQADRHPGGAVRPTGSRTFTPAPPR